MAKCTKCGHPDAYVGAVFVECPNDVCDLYNEDWKLQIEKQQSLPFEKSNKDDSEDTPLPFGASSRFSDLGGLFGGLYGDDDGSD